MTAIPGKSVFTGDLAELLSDIKKRLEENNLFLKSFETDSQLDEERQDEDPESTGEFEEL